MDSIRGGRDIHGTSATAAAAIAAVVHQQTDWPLLHAVRAVAAISTHRHDGAGLAPPDIVSDDQHRATGTTASTSDSTPTIRGSGTVVPVLAIVVSLVILVGASREQLMGGVLALVVGMIVVLWNDRINGGPGSQQTASHESAVTWNRGSE